MGSEIHSILVEKSATFKDLFKWELSVFFECKCLVYIPTLPGFKPWKG